MKKLNFKNVPVTNIDGTVKEMDLSKEIGNIIFRTTKDLGELEIAREIYHKGEIEVDEKTADMIKMHIDENFVAFIKVALNPLFK